MVKKRLPGEKEVEEPGEEKEAKEEKEIGEKADEKKLVIKIKKPNLKFLKPLKPYVVLIAVVIIATFFMFRGFITGYATFGDMVKLSYSLELEDGAIIDSGSGGFILGSISTEFGFISNKLDNIVKKMKPGEEKTITLKPEDAFGKRDIRNLDIINRTAEWDSPITLGPEDGFSLTAWKEWFKEEEGRYPEIGESMPFNQLWDTTIIRMTGDTITLQHNLTEGDILPLEPDGSAIVHFERNKIILTLTPGKQWFMGGILVNVVDITDEKITLDYNHEFAGRTIIVKIEVLEMEKATSTKEEDTCYGKYGIASGTVLFVYSNSCGYCAKMKPIVEELEKEGYSFYWVESGDSEARAITNECFGDVPSRGVPQFICVNDKSEHTGAMPKENLKEFADRCKKAKIAVATDKINTDQQKEIAGFVNCLKEAGFRIYGANWCGWTKRLVESFGGFDAVKPIYTECTENQELCQEKGVQGYPTLLINDQPYTDQRTFEGFAQVTGCKAVQEIVEQDTSDGSGSCG